MWQEYWIFAGIWTLPSRSVSRVKPLLSWVSRALPIGM